MLKKRVNIIVFVLLVPPLLIFCSKASSDPDWLGGEWDYRIKITIDHDDVDQILTNFPIMLHLSNSSSGINNEDVSFIFDELQNDNNRKKIAITTSDGTTQCYVEIEEWNIALEQAWLWIKVPNVSSTNDTDLYLYYDKDVEDNTAYVGDTGSTPAKNVWDNNFRSIYHFHNEEYIYGTDSGLFGHLFANASEEPAFNRFTFRHLYFPHLNASDYDNMTVKVQGTDNARIMLRFFMSDGSGFDFVYWQTVTVTNNTVYDLTPWNGKTIRGDVYLAVRTEDGNDLSVFFTEMAWNNASGSYYFDLVTMNQYGWHVDYRYTYESCVYLCGIPVSLTDSTSNQNHAFKAYDKPLLGDGIINSGTTYFDGQTDNYGKIVLDPSCINMTSALTLETFYNTPLATDSTSRRIIQRTDYNDDGGFFLEDQNSKIDWEVYTGGVWKTPTSINISIDTWYYIASSYGQTESECKLRVNNEVTSVDGGGNPIAEPPEVSQNFIGRKRNGYTGSPFGNTIYGKLDEVRISNSCRTEAWIKASYESGRDDLLDFWEVECMPSEQEYPPVIDFPFGKPVEFDASMILPAYLIQPFNPHFQVVVTLVNPSSENIEVVLHWWVTDSKTGERVSNGTVSSLIQSSEKKYIKIRPPTPDVGSYSFHVSADGSESLSIGGLTTQTFKVYSLFGWLFFHEGIIIVLIAVVVIVLVVVAWLKREEYL